MEICQVQVQTVNELSFRSRVLDILQVLLASIAARKMHGPLRPLLPSQYTLCPLAAFFELLMNHLPQQSTIFKGKLFGVCKIENWRKYEI
jgi:hypothetical protein